jgi:hypothetical protein
MISAYPDALFTVDAMGMMLGRFIDLFCGSGGLRLGPSENDMAKTPVRRLLKFPKGSIGLGGILAQSETVVRAFGPNKGFSLMLLALLAGAVFPVGAVILLAKAIARGLG